MAYRDQAAAREGQGPARSSGTAAQARPSAGDRGTAITGRPRRALSIHPEGRDVSNGANGGLPDQHGGRPPRMRADRQKHRQRKPNPPLPSRDIPVPG